MFDPDVKEILPPDPPPALVAVVLPPFAEYTPPPVTVALGASIHILPPDPPPALVELPPSAKILPLLVRVPVITNLIAPPPVPVEFKLLSTEPPPEPVSVGCVT